MRSPFFITVAVAALIGVSCGSDDSGDEGADSSAEPAEEAPADTEPMDTAAAVTEAAGTEPVDTAAAGTEAAGTEPVDTGAEGGGESGAPVTVAPTDLGDVLVDAGGFVLYGFTPDEGGTPTCEDACADAWPPVFAESADLPAGLDAAVFSVVERSDGSFQLAAGGWPLYRFAGDVSPGDTTGQESGGVWFVVAPDGTLIM